MARDVARASLYQAKINLWVEDGPTRAYLDAVWNSPDVGYLIGGGNEGVQAIVNDAEKAGYPNVFAVIDRDFRPTNQPSWFAPNKTSRKFILPVHEIENYFLDARALAASRFNNLSKTESEIEAMLETTATGLCWWAACRKVIAEIRGRFQEGFLAHPSLDVKSENQARDHICRSPWFQGLTQKVSQTTEADVHQLLSAAHSQVTQSLCDGSWKIVFAGKEILHDVSSRICDRHAFVNYNPTPSQFDEDLAKEIGAWQRLNQAVPPDLIKLLSALQQRIALVPTRP
jgi:hypothetical protein